MLRNACELGLEGIVAKRKDSPYRSGYVEAWIKVKGTQTEAFAVIGSERVGRSDLRALKLATLAEGELVPRASVGSGLNAKVSRELLTALDLGRPVVVDVELRGITLAGELRHPVFKGWHEDPTFL